MLSQDCRTSVTYDYTKDEESKFNEVESTAFTEGHYEFDTLSNDEPFWEPASVEDELKKQLHDITLFREHYVSQSQ